MTAVRDPEGNETRALHQLADFTGKDVLEIGCGDGRLTWRYADVVRSALGLDPSASAVESAWAALPARLRPTVRFQVADVITAELPAEAFDVALLAWSL